MFIAHFLALAAQALAHFLPETAGVDDLHQPLAVRRFAVGEYPHVSADAGVVEHVGGQADDGLHQVVLQHVAADFGFARAGAAGEQGRAVEHDAEAAAALHRRTHLADEVQQEQQRAVRDAGQAGAEASVVALASVLLADFLLDLLPFHAERRIGQHVVEFPVRVAVVREGVAGVSRHTAKGECCNGQRHNQVLHGQAFSSTQALALLSPHGCLGACRT